MVRCDDCGMPADLVHGRCLVCGQVVPGADEAEVMDEEPFDLNEGGQRCDG